MSAEVVLTQPAAPSAGAEGEKIALARARIASWLVVLALVVFVLILWGGIVRLSGSGLSIPEWPIVNGSLLPPFSSGDWDAVYRTYHREILHITDLGSPEAIPPRRFKAMFTIEYLHRFLASLTGILFLAIFVRAWRLKPVRSQVKGLLITAAFFLVAQAVLGGIVVKRELEAEVVAGHLGLAFLFFATILWMALRLLRLPAAARVLPQSKLRLLAWSATGTVFLQILSGGLVAGTHAGWMMNTFPKMGDFLVPPLSVLWSSIYPTRWHNLVENQVLLQFFHRWWAFVATLVVLFLIVRAIPFPLSPRGRLGLRAVGSVVVLQVLLGIGNLLMRVPFWLSLVHLATALFLFGLLVLITHELRYRYETFPR